jgi:circadian clock protein KaiC
MTARLELARTGDAALDRILGGGIPVRSMVVLAGEPGSGKSVLSLQLLFHAARQGKTSLYFTTLSEPAVKLLRYMQEFDFFDPALVGERVIFADLGAAVRQGADRTLAELETRVEEHEPAFVVIDSFRAIGECLGGPMRPFIYDLAVRMTGWGATTILVGEYGADEGAGSPEFAIADGIVRLGTERQELTSLRQLEVVKLRGAAYLSGRHFFDIGRGGVSFYPRVSAPDEGEARAVSEASDRLRVGVAGIDELLHGGLPRGTVSVIQGGTGTGKTLLGLTFLLEGARAGERGIFFSLEETPDQIRRVARGIGWSGLAEAERAGLIELSYTSPVELSTDRYLHEVRRQVRELGARRAVFDSLTTLSLGVPSPRRFKELVYAVAKHMRALDVTLLMNVESEQLLGSARLTGEGVSFLADNLIQLRYVELGGRLERAISVVKARGIAHESELRALTIAAGGLTVTAGRFKGLRGVLTGLPTQDDA